MTAAEDTDGRRRRWKRAGSLIVAFALMGCPAVDEVERRAAQDEKYLKACQAELSRANEQAKALGKSFAQVAEAVPPVGKIQAEIAQLVPQEVRVAVNDRVILLVHSIDVLTQQNMQASAERRRILLELTTANRVQSRLEAKEHEMETLRTDFESRARALDERANLERQAIARRAASLIDAVRAFDERIDCNGCSEPVTMTGAFKRHGEAKKAVLDFHRHLLEELSTLSLEAPADPPAAEPGT